MSRVERVKQYANPASKANWDGEARDKANLGRWSQRAADNSKVAPRARSGEMRLDDTGDMTLRATASKPRKSAAGKDDLNSDGGSSFMPGTRRIA